jgi:hypothetical protein
MLDVDYLKFVYFISNPRAVLFLAKQNSVRIFLPIFILYTERGIQTKNANFELLDKDSEIRLKSIKYMEDDSAFLGQFVTKIKELSNPSVF